MELTPRPNTPIDAEAAEQHENLLSAIALGKTLAFLVYSFLALVIAMGVGAIVTGVQASEPGALRLTYVVFFGCEILLLYLVVKGWLPATSGAAAMPFSEKQAAYGIALLSVLPWLFRPDPAWFTVFTWLVNVLLIIVVAVFFVVKSAISGRLRFRVLAVALIPAVQLYAASHAV